MLLGAPGGPTVCLEFSAVIDGEKQTHVCFLSFLFLPFFLFFGQLTSTTHFEAQMKIICEGEVIITASSCIKHISPQSCAHCSRRNGENDGEVTKETSDHPPLPPLAGKLSSSLCWQESSHQPGATCCRPSTQLLLIVFLFIYFTIDFSVEADMALIHSDWLSWCDGWNKASKQTQCKTSVTCSCVCLCESLRVCLFVCMCIRVCVCVCLHSHLYQSVSEYRFATPSDRVCVYTHEEHVVAAEGKREEAGQCVIIILRVSP